MKVRIELTVAVDPAEWAETYGINDRDLASVRDDVKRWAATALSHHPDGLIELVPTPERPISAAVLGRWPSASCCDEPRVSRGVDACYDMTTRWCVGAAASRLSPAPVNRVPAGPMNARADMARSEGVWAHVIVDDLGEPALADNDTLAILRDALPQGWTISQLWIQPGVGRRDV